MSPLCPGVFLTALLAVVNLPSCDSSESPTQDATVGCLDGSCTASRAPEMVGTQNGGRKHVCFRPEIPWSSWGEKSRGQCARRQDRVAASYGPHVEPLPKACPYTEPVHTFFWGQWSHWSPCSVTCGTGVRVRVRVCTDMAVPYVSLPPVMCGEVPIGNEMEETCFNQHCLDDQCENTHAFEDVGNADSGTGGGEPVDTMQDTECLTSETIEGEGSYTQQEGAESHGGEGAHQHGEQESPVNEEPQHGFEECFEEHHQDHQETNQEQREGQEHGDHHGGHDHHEHHEDHGDTHRDHDHQQDHQEHQDDGTFEQGPEDHGERIDDQANSNDNPEHHDHGEQDQTGQHDPGDGDHMDNQDNADHAEQDHPQDQGDAHDQAEHGDQDQGDPHQDQTEDHHDDGMDDDHAEPDHQDGVECEAEDGTQDQPDDTQDGEAAEDNQDESGAQQDGDENAEDQGDDHDDPDPDDGDDAEDEQEEEEEKGKRKRRFEDEEEEEQETDDKEDDEEDKKKRKRRRKKKKKRKKKRQHEGDCSSCTEETEETDCDIIHRRHSIGVLRSKSRTSLGQNDSTDFDQRRKSHASISSIGSEQSLHAHPVYHRSRSEGGSVASITSTGSVTSTEDSYSVPFYEYYDSSDSDLYTEETDTSSSYEDEVSEDLESSSENEVEGGTTDNADTTDVAEGNDDPDIEDVLNTTLSGPITSCIPQIITPDMNMYAFPENHEAIVNISSPSSSSIGPVTSVIAENITADTDVRVVGGLPQSPLEEITPSCRDIVAATDSLLEVAADNYMPRDDCKISDNSTCAKPTSLTTLHDNTSEQTSIKHIKNRPLPVLESDNLIPDAGEVIGVPTALDCNNIISCADTLARTILNDATGDPRSQHSSFIPTSPIDVGSAQVDLVDTHSSLICSSNTAGIANAPKESSNFDSCARDNVEPRIDIVGNLTSPSSLSISGAEKKSVLEDPRQANDHQHELLATALADFIVQDALSCPAVVGTATVPANKTETSHAKKQTGDTNNSSPNYNT